MKYLVSFLFLFSCAFAKAQLNYVLNPGYEEYSQCPNGYDQISFANYWTAIDSSGQSVCTPEYLNVCSGGNIYVGVPNGAFYYQYPRTGNGMAFNVFSYDEYVPDVISYYYRDYMQGRLHTILTANTSYCVSFYVVLAEESGYAIKNIGAYLDDGSIDTVDSCGYPQVNYIPQIEATTFITDTFNWTRVEGTFVANGTERFITLGNFHDIYNTDTLSVDESGLKHYTWYLIDDVSVIESDLPAFAGNDTWVVEGDSVFIGRTPEVGLDCKWYINGSIIDSGAGIWVHPTATTTYVVGQTICGLVKTDTVTIEVWAASVNGITNGQQVTIYPNPATNQLMVQQDKVIFTQAIITNQLGQTLHTEILSGEETILDIEALPAGVYNITLEGDKGKEIRRFVKMQ